MKEKLVASDVPLRKKKVPLSNCIILKIFKKVYLEIIMPLRPRMIYKEGYSFSAIGVPTFAPGHSLPGYKPLRESELTRGWVSLEVWTLGTQAANGRGSYRGAR